MFYSSSVSSSYCILHHHHFLAGPFCHCHLQQLCPHMDEHYKVQLAGGTLCRKQPGRVELAGLEADADDVADAADDYG